MLRRTKFVIPNLPDHVLCEIRDYVTQEFQEGLLFTMTLEQARKRNKVCDSINQLFPRYVEMVSSAEILRRTGMSDDAIEQALGALDTLV